MRCAHFGPLCLAVTLALGSTPATALSHSPEESVLALEERALSLEEIQEKVPPAAPAAKPAQPPAPGRARQAPPAGPKLTLTVMVTALDGKTLPDVVVKASGPVDRETPTDSSGLVNFANMSSGTYRLRFEHEGFITFEKEVSLSAKPLRASASLSAAPPAPPPPRPEPAPAPITQPVAPGDYQPNVANFLSWLDSSFIGRAPSKRLASGCTATATTTMIQTNEAIAERTRPDTDETIYVVAGEGTLRMGGREHALSAGSLVTAPRGTTLSITRRGSRPLMFVSTLSGPPCQPGQ
jgi:mannose-6-phosphate isomerase-like protein (cupin superfamily)